MYGAVQRGGLFQLSPALYYDREAVAVLFLMLDRALSVLEQPRRLPRPWPMFCGHSIDSRPITFEPKVKTWNGS
jgi:hypothetical protein